jgi:hypothetical protein
MPGGHNENTKLLGFFADKELLAKVDEARGGKVRSQFLREATVEYMAAHGVKVPENLKHPPSRAGKGGPIKYRISRFNAPQKTKQTGKTDKFLEILKRGADDPPPAPRPAPAKAHPTPRGV